MRHRNGVVLVVACALFVSAAEGRVRAVRSGSPKGLTANADAYAVGQGKALSIAVSRGVLANDRDPDKKPLIAILVSNPAHGTLTFRPEGSFVYTNDGTGAASDAFSYQASNGTARSNIAQVTIAIGPADAVTATSDAFSLAHGASITVPAPGVLGNDIDPEGAPLIAMQAVPPTNGSLALNANGSFVYTHHGTNTTSDSFAYRATNGVLTSVPSIVSLTIGPDVAPLVTSQRYSILQNETLIVPVPGVLAGAIDPDSSTLTAILQKPAAHGVVTLDPKGSFVYQPANGYSGADSFTYRASDGILTSNEGTASITVQPPLPPVAVNDRYVATAATLNINAPGIFGNDTRNGATLASFGANGTDQNGIGLPAITAQNGKVTLNADGSFAYTAPNPSFAGDDTFQYVIRNSAGSSAAKVTITVAPVNTNCPPIAITTATVPAGFTGTTYPAFSFAQTGGAAPVVWSATGSLPPGMQLSNSGVLSGTPTAVGSFSFTITVTDANGCSKPKVFTLTTNCSTVTIAATGLAPAKETIAYVPVTLQQTGGTGQITWTLFSGRLPAGMTFSTAGVISGTPAEAGAFPFTARATDANGCTGTRNFSLTVSPRCPTMTITTSSVPSAFAGAAYPAVSFQHTGGVAPITWSSGALPPGMSFSAAGVLSGTPATLGVFNIRVTATDANACAANAVVQLAVVKSTCPAITIDDPSSTTATQGSPYTTTTLKASGGTAPYTWTIASGTLPPGMTLSPFGVLSGTPSQSGTFPFILLATDVNGCFQWKSISFIVDSLCDTLDITGAPPAGTTGAAYPAFNFTQSGGVEPVTWSAGAMPPGMTLSSAGVLSGVSLVAGNYNLALTIVDANGCRWTEVVAFAIVDRTCSAITIEELESTSATQGTPFTAETLTASGGTSPYTWSIVSGALPPGMTLSPFGVLSGTPTQSGTFDFTVLVTDANGCTSWMLSTLEVDSLCDTIDIAGDPPDGTTGAVYPAFNFTQDGGVEPVTWTAGVMPAGMTFSSAGVLSGTPSIAGTYNLAITVTDANGCTATVVVQLEVANRTCSAITIEDLESDSATQGTPFTAETLTASGGTSPYTWSIASGALPPGMTLSPFGVLSGTPTQSGTFDFTVLATDANGCTSWMLVSFVVDSLCETIDITGDPPDGTTGVAYPAFNFTQSGGVEPVTWSAGAMPPGMTLSSAGVLSGVSLVAGNYNLALTIVDANGCRWTEVVAFAIVDRTCSAITIEELESTSATQGTPFTAETLTASGGTSPYTWSIASGALPPGMTLSPFGVLSGTPTQSGAFDFTVLVTDANGCTTWTLFSLEVESLCDAIDITGDPPDATTGAVYPAFNFTQSGGVEPVSWSAGVMPAGMTFSSAGVLSGTPSIAGTYNLTITVTDANGCTATVVVQLEVANRTCSAITIEDLESDSATQGTPFTAETLTASGGTSPYTWSIASGALPPGMSLSSFGVLSGTPLQSGTFDFTVLATDANGCTSWTLFSLEVEAACTSITITGDLTDAQAGLAYPAFAFSHDSDALPVTWSAGQLPPGMSFSTDGVLSGTPTVHGDFTLQLKVTDANGCVGTASVTLTIDCPAMFITASATIGSSTLARGTINAPYGPVTFTATGGVGAIVWKIKSGTLPAGLSFSNSGSLSGMPVSEGTSEFEVEATDANGCTGSADFEITIDCQSIAVSNPTIATGTVNVPLGPALFTQTGARGTWSFDTASDLPDGVELAPNGLLYGTPTESGSFPITATVTDSGGCTGQSSGYQLVICTLTVNNPVTTSATTGVAVSETFTVTNATGSTRFTYSGTLPAGLQFTSNDALQTATITGTPTQTGSFPITVTVTDSLSCQRTGSTWTLTVCGTIDVVADTSLQASPDQNHVTTFTAKMDGQAVLASFQALTTLVKGLDLARAMAIDHEGDVYIADTNHLTIKRWDSGTNSVAVIVNGGVQFPGGIALHGNEVYISDSLNNRILSAAKDGTSLSVLINTPNVNAPQQIAIDSGGNIYIADSGSNTVKRWEASNNTVTTIASGLQSPYGVAVSGDGKTVYFSELGLSTGSGKIWKWTQNSGQTTWTESSGTKSQLSSDLLDPNSLALDSSGNLYFVQVSGGVLQRIKSSGDVETVLSGVSPLTVALDPFDRVYIVDFGGAYGVYQQQAARIIGAPPGMAFSEQGTLSGAPIASGEFDMRIIAETADGCQGSAEHTLAVSCGSVAIAPSDVSHYVASGRAFESNVFTVSGNLSDPVTWTIDNAPGGVYVEASGHTAKIKGTTSGFRGHYIVIRARDNIGCTDTAAYRLYVGLIQLPPIVLTP